MLVRDASPSLPLEPALRWPGRSEQGSDAGSAATGSPAASADGLAATSREDRVILSQRAQARLEPAQTAADPASADPGDRFELSKEEEQAVDQLRDRDQEVRNHEEAHARVGGPYAGSPSYDYTVGPDNKRYAVSGSVPIDTAPIPEDPEGTIDKMEVVKAAALAPAQPSGQDIKVAGIAEQHKQQASAELRTLRQAETRGEFDPKTGEAAARKAAESYASAQTTGRASFVSPSVGQPGSDISGLIGLIA